MVIAGKNVTIDLKKRWYKTKIGEKEEVPSRLWERKKWYQASLPPSWRTFRHDKALSRCVIMLESPDGKGEGQDKCSNCLCNLNKESFVKFNHGPWRCDCIWHNWPWWLLLVILIIAVTTDKNGGRRQEGGGRLFLSNLAFFPSHLML